MAQTVLITGASGFIAAHVIELSSKRDTIFAELCALKRRSRSSQDARKVL